MTTFEVIDIKKMVEDAPDFCPITGLKKITAYAFDEGVVYGADMPHDAYTLPTYDPKEKAFYRTRIDMDDEFRRHHEIICELEELRGRDDFEDIKRFYGITEEVPCDAK